MFSWRPNPSAPLWDASDPGDIDGPYFSDINVDHVKQIGPSCVATTLAMIARTTGANVNPDDFKKITNSQSPHYCTPNNT